MDLYRIKQFYWSVTSKFDEQDKTFIDKYLELQEKELFFKLTQYEQKHCVKVAKYVEEKLIISGDNLNLLVRAALLHDIGKINGKVNSISKTLLVIADNISSGKLKKFSNLKTINNYYYHGDKAYNLLKEYSYDERLLYLIKNHHNDDIIGDKGLDLLKTADEKF